MRRFKIIIAGILTGLFFFLPQSWAKEIAAPDLTLKEAVTRAVAHSEELKAAELGVKKTKKMRENASDILNFIPAGGGGPVMAEAEAMYYGLVQSDLGWSIQKKQYEAKKDSIILDTFKKYLDVLHAQENLDTAEIEKVAAEENLRVAKTSFRAGVVTSAAVIAAEAKAKGADKKLEAAEEALDKAYVALNRIVGLGHKDRPVLVDEIAFEPLKIDDVNVEVQRAVETSKDIFVLKKMVSVKKVELDLLTTAPYTTPELTNYTDYEVKEYDVDIAEKNVQDAKEKMREQVRSLYHDIKALEEQYTAAVKGLEAAKEGLRVAKVRYLVGMGTDLNLKDAEAEVARAENGIASIVYQHACLCATFRLLAGKEIVKI